MASAASADRVQSGILRISVSTGQVAGNPTDFRSRTLSLTPNRHEIPTRTSLRDGVVILRESCFHCHVRGGKTWPLI